MNKKITAFILSLCTLSVFAQNDGAFNGMSVSTGNLHPESSNYGVVLQNELIQVTEFDDEVKYDVVYEFKNATANFATVSAVMPLKIYFNEFGYGKRAKLLDDLATVPTFSDIFAVQDRSVDTREQIRKNFQQRLFVRKYISIDNLKQLGIHVDMFRNNTRINIKKVMCELKFTDATPLYLPKNTEVLSMEISFIIEMNFTPDEETNVLTFITMPSVNAGIDRTESYSMYELGYEKNWSGRLNGLYLQHDIFKTTPILPAKMSEFKTHVSGERDQVVAFEDIMLVDKDKIAFYHISNNKACNSGNLFNEQSIVPAAIKNITASSWVKTDSEMPKRFFYNTPMIAFSDSLHPYQTGTLTGIDALNNATKVTNYNNLSYYDYIKANCKNNVPGISLKESGNPVYAFDISDHIYEDSTYEGRENLARQTCWCEAAAGPGAGEYIEFEITQPARAMKIYNGNQSSKKVFDESSKADIIVITSLDGHKINPNADNPAVMRSSIIDLTILNVYELNLLPGKYRVAIDAVDKGTTPVTCFSTIAFDFEVRDEWYLKSQGMLRAFFKK
ncbi:MAG: hypothetical protein WBP31_06410 [Chitinophagales bacterium]|jgi:hypothetical protein|nr:hypothetical protein [Bacteroidota bacterium]MBP8248981.1 hypothetical protein [Chitinophagales bacterium]MBK9506686.1 hypothetical protein [Bacteroidota bacterium]MBK9554311.1 hypothetical protein [Bacteroidota bacterium]MBL0280079.1 hypothetical protein [Bacteroidota bacterium]